MLDGSLADRGASAIESARRLAPEIASAAADIEVARKVTGPVMAALHDAQLFRMLIPQSLGGLELDLLSFVKAIELIAMADASTAWCVGQGSGCSFTAAYLDPPVAREVFGAPDAVLAWGPSNRNARATRCDGGFKVSGKWVFASGNRNAKWLAGHCTVVEADGSPRMAPNGKPVERSFLFKREAAQIEDVWQVMGLRGTGSDNYSVEDLIVPEAYGFTRDHVPDRRETGPLYKFSVINLYGFAFGAVALGVAQQMLDDFIALAKTKSPNSGGPVLRENGAIQQQTGLNEARLQAARSYLHHTLEEIWLHAEAGREFSAQQKISLRMMTTFVIQTGREVADSVYRAAGATAIFTDQAFERRFRDINAVIQQGQGHLSNYDIAGQMLLGLDVAPKR